MPGYWSGLSIGGGAATSTMWHEELQEMRVLLWTAPEAWSLVSLRIKPKACSRIVK
jgi:hypothetical protein